MTGLRLGDEIDICFVWSGLARGDGKGSVQPWRHGCQLWGFAWRGFKMADAGIQGGKEGCTKITKLV